MNNLIKRIWKQNNMTSIEDLQGSAFTAESGGHTFQISGVDANGDALSLSGTVVASFIRSDVTTVALSGSASGGVVSVTLTAECYGVPGRFGLVIFLTSDSQKTAIYSCVGNVARSSTGNVSPGTTANVVDLINQINAAVATIPASYSALMADIAPTYSDSALYAVGNYAWYNGDLKRCISPITTAESYTAAHWTSAVLGQDVSDLKSALKRIDTSYNNEKANMPILSEKWTKGVINANGIIVDSPGYISTPEYLVFNEEITILNFNATVHSIVTMYNNDYTVNRRVTVTQRAARITAGTLFRISVSVGGEPITNINDIAKNILYCKNGYANDSVYDEKLLVNLADPDTIQIDKGYDEETGNIIDAQDWAITDYIPCSADSPMCVYYNHQSLFDNDAMRYKIGIYDDNKNWIQTIRVWQNTLSDRKWVNFNVNGFVRFAIRDGSSQYSILLSTLIVLSQNSLRSSIYDSIPEQYIKSPIDLIKYDYDNYLPGKGFSYQTSTIIDAASAFITGYIPVRFSDVLSAVKNGEDVTGTTVNTILKIALYSKTKQWVRTIDRSKPTSDTYYLTTPLKVDFDGYMRIQGVFDLLPYSIHLDSVRSISKDIINEYDTNSSTVDVIVFAGQSNMAGRGVTTEAYPETYPVVPNGYAYEFRAVTDPTKLYVLAEPFGVSENRSTGIDDGRKKTGDMVAAFAIQYYQGNGNVPLVGVSASKGGSGIDEWQPDAEAGYLDDAISRFNDCVSYLIANNYKIRHKYLCWCQGEHDWGTYSTYASRWQTMFDQFKAAGIEKCLMVRIGNTGSGDGHFTNIIGVQSEMAQTNEDIVMISTDFASMADRGMMKDDLHYVQAAYNECGKYAGTNAAIYAAFGKEPTMYDSENGGLYFSHKN